MNETNKIDELLLGKFLAGEATPEEAIVVTDWINESNDNKALFASTEGAWMLNSAYGHSLPDKNKIMDLLLSPQKIAKSKRLIFFTPFKIAATILLLITAGAATFFFTNTSPEIAWITKKSDKKIVMVKLPEGSSAVLNGKSELLFPQQFNTDVRTVKLSGEAFFDVVHRPDQPFIISVDDINIKVLGTAFNVQTLEEPPSIETQVIRGKVMMYNDEKQIIIEPGWVGRYDKNTGELSLRKSVNENNAAYATRSFLFEDASLREVMHDLGKGYGVTFVLENEKINDCRFTSAYHTKSLPFILSVMSASLNISYTVKGDTVHISGDGCL